MSPPTAAEWARLVDDVDQLDESVRRLSEAEARADERRSQVASSLDDLKARAQQCEGAIVRLDAAVARVEAKLDAVLARLESAPRGWRAQDYAAVLVAVGSTIGAIATAIGAYTGHLPGQTAIASEPPSQVIEAQQ